MIEVSDCARNAQEVRGPRTLKAVFVTKPSSMNTLTGPARSSYSLVFLSVPSMNAEVFLRGTQTYLSSAVKSSIAMDTL